MAGRPHHARQRPRLELWGGTDCTFNRVGDECFDQLEQSGHAARVEDLDRFAALGIRAMRYPVLWERVAPSSPEELDWSWTDERLNRLRELGIRPIAGLLHHGNGPPYTSLLDPGFSEKLARFARTVAERYEWLDAYTPINEPLTTARFSGLYGLWYPHGRDSRTLIRLLLTQCRAVVLAMRQIRQINPAAQLVQTDDLGKAFSTPRLAHQARFENHRRWLTFDLLCGRVDRRHPLWRYLLAHGASQEELAWFREHPCPPDIIGIDHYLSSERYLDEHLERYPAECHGGNGHETYADVLAARVRHAGPAGPERLARETWERYELPIALTEVHNGCTREEQMRWFLQVWRSAERLRLEGVDVRAVTAWSLLGIYGWDALATGHGGYEAGVYDLRSPQPRPTAMVQLLRDLSAGRRPDHPLLEVPGWWRRPVRFQYGFSLKDNGEAETVDPTKSDLVRYRHVAPVLITGGRGLLAHALARLCELRGIPYRLLGHAELDIADPVAVQSAIQMYRPWAIVNAAGYARIDQAELEPEACYRANARGPHVLAETCARHGVQLLTFSSHLVFDGSKRAPYLESDAPAPLSVYGHSKAQGEALVLTALPSALIVRNGPFFGPWDEVNLVARALRSLAEAGTFEAPDDQVVAPSYVPDLVNISLDLLIDRECGIWHLSNVGEITPAGLAREAARLAGVNPAGVVGRSAPGVGPLAPRPDYSVLSSERGTLLGPLERALAQCLAARTEARVPVAVSAIES